MERRRFNLLTRISLILFLAATGAGIRSAGVASEWTACCYGNSDGRQDVILFSRWGCLGVALISANVYANVPPYRGVVEAPASQVLHLDWSYLGFNVDIGGNPPQRLLLTVPYWFLSLLTAILPCLWLWLYCRHRRAVRQGLCPTCGYDLRASRDRCPECGTPIPAQAASRGGKA